MKYRYGNELKYLKASKGKVGKGTPIRTIYLLSALPGTQTAVDELCRPWGVSDLS